MPAPKGLKMKKTHLLIALLIFASIANAQTPIDSRTPERPPSLQNGNTYNNNPSNWKGKKVYGTFTQDYHENGYRIKGSFSGKRDPYILMQRSATSKYGYGPAKLDQYSTDKQAFEARKKEMDEEIRKHNETLNWSNAPRTHDDKRVFVTYTQHNPVTDKIKYGSTSGFGNPHAIVAGNIALPASYYHKTSSGHLVDDEHFGVPKLHSYTTDRNEFLKQERDLSTKVRLYNNQYKQSNLH